MVLRSLLSLLLNWFRKVKQIHFCMLFCVGCIYVLWVTFRLWRFVSFVMSWNGCKMVLANTGGPHPSQMPPIWGPHPLKRPSVHIWQQWSLSDCSNQTAIMERESVSQWVGLFFKYCRNRMARTDFYATLVKLGIVFCWCRAHSKCCLAGFLFLSSVAGLRLATPAKGTCIWTLRHLN